MSQHSKVPKHNFVKGEKGKYLDKLSSFLELLKFMPMLNLDDLDNAKVISKPRTIEQQKKIAENKINAWFLHFLI
jgi:hypothetical protein